MLCIWLRWTFGAEPSGKVVSCFQWLLAVMVMIAACRYAQQSWPGGAHTVIGIILLLLAFWSVQKGTSAAARVGSVLFWFVLILYLVLFGAALKDVRMEWLRPVKGDVNAFGCVLLLTPAAATVHLYNKEGIKPRLLLIGLFAIVSAVLTAGVLSPQVALHKDHAFYEMTRSLNLLGQARRFEAVLSAGMTAAWFALLSLYLSLCKHYSEMLHPEWGTRGTVAAAAIVVVVLLCDLHIPEILLLITGAIFWVLLPILTQGLDRKKKS